MTLGAGSNPSRPDSKPAPIDAAFDKQDLRESVFTPEELVEQQKQLELSLKEKREKREAAEKADQTEEEEIARLDKKLEQDEDSVGEETPEESEGVEQVEKKGKKKGFFESFFSKDTVKAIRDALEPFFEALGLAGALDFFDNLIKSSADEVEFEKDKYEKHELFDQMRKWNSSRERIGKVAESVSAHYKDVPTNLLSSVMLNTDLKKIDGSTQEFRDFKDHMLGDPRRARRYRVAMLAADLSEYTSAEHNETAAKLPEIQAEFIAYKLSRVRQDTSVYGNGEEEHAKLFYAFEEGVDAYKAAESINESTDGSLFLEGEGFENYSKAGKFSLTLKTLMDGGKLESTDENTEALEYEDGTSEAESKYTLSDKLPGVEVAVSPGIVQAAKKLIETKNNLGAKDCWDWGNKLMESATGKGLAHYPRIFEGAVYRDYSQNLNLSKEERHQLAKTQEFDEWELLKPGVHLVYYNGNGGDKFGNHSVILLDFDPSTKTAEVAGLPRPGSDPVIYKNISLKDHPVQMVRAPKLVRAVS